MEASKTRSLTLKICGPDRHVFQFSHASGHGRTIQEAERQREQLACVDVERNEKQYAIHLNIRHPCCNFMELVILITTRSKQQ